MASNGTTWINLMMGYLDKTHLEEINKIFTEFENKIFSSDYNFDEIKQVINKNIPEILDADLLRIEQRLNEIRNVISSKVENIEDYTLSEIDFKDEFNEIRDVDVFEKRKAMMKTIEDNISYNKPIHVTGKSEKMDDVYKSRNPFFAPTLNLDLFEGIYGYKPFINNSLFDGFDQKEFLKHYSKVMVFKIESNVKVFEFGIEYEQNIYALNKMYEHDQKTLRNLTGRIYITNLLSDTEELDYKLVVYSGDTDGLIRYEETLGPEFYFKCFKDNGYLYLFCEDVKPFRMIGFCRLSCHPSNKDTKYYLYLVPMNRHQYMNDEEKDLIKYPENKNQFRIDKNNHVLTYNEFFQFPFYNFVFFRPDNFISGWTIAPYEYFNNEKNERFTIPFDAVRLRQYHQLQLEKNKITELKILKFIDNNVFISNNTIDFLFRGMKVGNRYFYSNIYFSINASQSFQVTDTQYILPNGFLDAIKNNWVMITYEDEYGIIYYKDINGKTKYRKFTLTANSNGCYDIVIENSDSNIFDLKRIEFDKIKNFPENINKDKNTLVLEVVQDINEGDYFTTFEIKRNINKSRIRLDIKFNEVTEYNKTDKFPLIIDADIDNGNFASEEISGNISVNINETEKALEYTTNGLGNCYLAIRLQSNNIRYTDNVKGVSFTIEKVANLVTDIQTCKISNLDTKYNTQVIDITSDSDKLEYEIKDPEIAYFDNLSRSIKGLKEGVTVLTITAEDTTKFLRKNQRIIIIKVSEEVIEQSEVDIDNDLTEDEKTAVEEYKKTLTIIENPDNKYFINNIEYRSDYEIQEGTYQVKERYNFNGILDSKQNLLFLNRRMVRKVDDQLENKDLVLDVKYKTFNTQSNLDKLHPNYINREILAHRFPYCPSSISLVNNRLVVFFVQTMQEDGSYDFNGKKFYYSDDFGTTWIESEEVLPYGIPKEKGGWISRTSNNGKILFLLKVGEYDENVEDNILLVSYDKGETWKEFPMTLETYFPIKKTDQKIKVQLKDFAVNDDGTIINLIDVNGKIYYHKELIDKDNLDNVIWVKGERFEEFNYNTHNDIKCIFYKKYETHEVQNIIVERSAKKPEIHKYTISSSNNYSYYRDQQYILDAKTRLYPYFLTNYILQPYNYYDIYEINKIGLDAYRKNGYQPLLGAYGTDSNLLEKMYDQIFTHTFSDFNKYYVIDQYTQISNIHGRARTFDSVKKNNINLYKDYFGMDFQILLSISDTSTFSNNYHLETIKLIQIEELYKKKKESNEVLEFTIQLPKVGIVTADGFGYSGEKEKLTQVEPIQKLFRTKIKSLDYTNDIIEINNSIKKYIKDKIKSSGNIESLVQFKIRIIHNHKYDKSDIKKTMQEGDGLVLTWPIPNKLWKPTDFRNLPSLVSIFDIIGNYNIKEIDKSLFVKYYHDYNLMLSKTRNAISNLDQLEKWYNLKYDIGPILNFDLDNPHNKIHISEKISGDPLKFLEELFKKDYEGIIGSIVSISVSILPTNLDSITDYKQSILKLKQDTNNLSNLIFDNSLNNKKFVTIEKNIIYENSNINLNG